MPSRPALGVARLERLLPSADAPVNARLFCYDDGLFVIVPAADIAPAPPGVWDKGGGDADPES